MFGDPRNNADRWAAWPARVAPSSQEDLNPVPQAAHAPPNAVGCGWCSQTPSTLTPRQVWAGTRASRYVAATAPHTRREQANMRAALIVARELLRCQLMESGRDALLERVAELLDVVATGALPFCSLLMLQAVVGSHGGPRRTRVPQVRQEASSTPGRQATLYAQSLPHHLR